MNDRISAGYIVFRERESREYLLLQRVNDELWDFPKGRIKPGESALESANRELKEEAGITIFTTYDFNHEIEFVNSEGIERKIMLFLAKIDQEPILSKEHNQFIWKGYEEARQLVKFKERQRVLDIAEKYLQIRLKTNKF